ncbi:hypothetical protein V502_08558 [Pseudogymnoascus sp. VKM F-4520 (FW-2644)]|nr:hypothetical protein V502_08558 [Pseudogymnoascus sp. VKM F-4520 (FW-2644)]
MVAPARSMFRVKWGHSPNSWISFHHCIIIADDCVTQRVTAETRGRIFDWGSYVNGKWVKGGLEAKVKDFGPEQYETGCKYGNKYECLGTTQRSDDEIKTVSKLVLITSLPTTAKMLSQGLS